MNVEDEYVCVGETVELFVSGAAQVKWEPSAGLSCSTCPDPTVDVDETTTYTVSAVSCLGNIVEATVTVFVEDAPELTVIEEVSILQGEEVTLVAATSDPSAIISWSTDLDGVICTDCPEVTVSPTEPTIYYATVESEFGCINEAVVRVKINDECKFGEFEIPNMISPNGDGVNDEFEIRYEGVTEISMLRIFNRWGELVFETENINDRWDGTFRGKELNPGVYVYYIEGLCLNGDTFTQTGNVTILK